jgi:TolB protein
MARRLVPSLVALTAALGIVVAACGDKPSAAPGLLSFDARPKATPGWQLWVVNRDGHGLKRLTHVDGDVKPSWSPDGSELVFERFGEYCPLDVCARIWRIAADGSGERPLTPLNVRAEAPDWAPAGGHIAYEQWPSSPGLEIDIYTMREDGTDRRRVVGARGSDQDPDWSADGEQIVFTSDRSSNFELYVVGADGGVPRQLTHTPSADEYGPRFSPDGKRIAFWRRGHKGDTIAILAVDGGGERTLSRAGKDANFPAWSPNGREIAFIRGSFDEAELWLIGSDGSSPRRLVRGDIFSGPLSEPESPDWAAARNLGSTVWRERCAGFDSRRLHSPRK